MGLALRMLWRDWRGGELRLLALAVVVAVAAVTSVAWLAQRVGGATEARASELLAADRVVRSSEPIPDAWLKLARDAGLRVARTTEFASVVLAGDRTHLVSAKAVSAGYPLRGQLRTRAGTDAPEKATGEIPPRGVAWVEPRLLTVLGLHVGDTLNLGDERFRVGRILTLEPDRSGFLYTLAPRVMINRADLPATGLIGRGSRVRYQLLLAGPQAALARVTKRLQREGGADLEVESPTDSRPGVREVVRNARRFMGLAALLTVLVAGVAVLLTVRHYAERQLTAVAVMRAMGATRGRILGLLAGKLLWLGLIAGFVGAVIGFGLHWAMLQAVRDLLGDRLPPPDLRPLLVGWLTAFAALLGFAFPTLARLRNVPPMRVLRRDLGRGLLSAGLPLTLAVLAIVALMAWQAQDVTLTAYVAGALAGTLLVLAAGAAGVVLLARRLARGRRRLLLLSGITRRPWTSVIQIVAVGTGLMALFLLLVVRTGLLDAWHDRIPPDAPNQFLINIQPDQVDGVRSLLAGHGVETEFYPMIRGRLVRINGEEVHPEQFDSDRARRLARREFNLSTAGELQGDNSVQSGTWWTSPHPPPQFSVESGIAEELGLHVGDTLTFEVGGTPVSARISNLRQVDWNSFNVNFFVIASPGVLDGYPTTWITSFYLPPGQDELLMQLVRQYPSVTTIDVGAILRTVRSIIDQGSRVVELMAVLTLGAGLLVLLAALQITGEARRFESALLRALGATGARVRAMARIEMWLIGGLAGLLAGVVATVGGVIVAQGLFDLHYPLRPLTVVAGTLVGMLTVWVAGGLGARRYYRVSPMRLLREGDE